MRHGVATRGRYVGHPRRPRRRRSRYGNGPTVAATLGTIGRAAITVEIRRRHDSGTTCPHIGTQTVTAERAGILASTRYSDAGLLRFKVAARQGGGTSVRRIAGFGRLFGRANSGSRELPRDFRGICVRPFLMPNSRKPHNQRLSPQYPQRDSNPCRHLERVSRRERSERQRTERAKSRGFADAAKVNGSGDSGRPRDFRGIDVDTQRRSVASLLRSLTMLGDSRIPQEATTRRNFDSNRSALSGDHGALGAELNLHRHAVA